MRRRAFLAAGVSAAAGLIAGLPAATATTPKRLPLAVLGTNCGDVHTGTETAQWRSHFTDVPAMTWARCYDPGDAVTARAAGADHVLLSMSAKEYWPDGTAAKVQHVTALAVDYVRAAGLKPGDMFTYVHEFERPSKHLAQYEKTGHGWTAMFRSIRAALRAEFPSVLMGPVPTGHGVLSGNCDPFWLNDTDQDFYSPDLYSGIKGSDPTTPFTARAVPVVAVIRHHHPTVQINFSEINTIDPALTPDWFAAAARGIGAVTRQDSTILFLFQGHQSFAPADFRKVAAAL